ncbi:MAG TPA: hypothetical protein VK822_20510 [Acetobacteraceae bacterium]|jgi:hypothetical protein|nr:hypothetical protein [Acetobacteraceae bacterium]
MATRLLDRVGDFTLRQAAEGQGAAPTVEDHDLPRRVTPRSHREAPWLIDGPINGERFRL